MGTWRFLTLVTAAAMAVGVGQPTFATDCRVVADFASQTIGEFPEDWTPKDDRARAIYRVVAEGSLRFLRATAEGTGVQIGKEFAWDLTTHPVLAWAWRPQVFPTGADERDASRNDSVLGVYAVFPNSPVSVKTVKYVWSLTAPAGTTASASRGLTRMIALRSGPPSGSGWVEEALDVARDYRRLFGESPKRPRGIALLTDADDTGSRAVGDYGAFRVCSAASRTSARPDESPARRP